MLSDFQITVPEIGTIAAASIPHVILTSNGTRELSDALRRRCLYCYVEFPSMEDELAILRRRLPGIEPALAGQNPMLGWARYEPLTRTMHALLPYIDRFAPAHSLDALAAIEPELRTL